MRIVGGRLRGRALSAPKSQAIRPTADRLRESLFNILAHGYGDPVSGARVLDLFAGTGALGLEAISRGAAFALFVDDGAEARALLRANVEALGLGGVTRIFRRDATKLGPAHPVEPFALVFLDPPYGRLVGAVCGPYARHPGGERLPHQLPCLQQPLWIWLAGARGDRLSARLPQPRRLHHGADRRDGAGLGATRLRETAGGGPRRQFAPTFSPAKRDPALRERWCAPDDMPVALCVSRFAPEKNFPLVLDAYRAMRAVRPDTRLILVGDGPMGGELKREGLGIVIAGRLVNGELSAHYASADIFLFPSTTETFGNVTMEAMASGLAVVAYDYAAARQHIVHGRSGLLAPVDDRIGFIEHAAALARDLPRARGGWGSMRARSPSRSAGTRWWRISRRCCARRSPSTPLRIAVPRPNGR